MTQEKINWPLLAAGISVNILMFAGGAGFSWTSPVLPKLKEASTENPFDTPITPMEESWITATLNLGSAFGPFCSVLFADRIGRKKTLIYFTIPMMIAYIIMAFSSSIEYYYLARFILGIGTGCSFSLVPLYLSEIAENSNRGLLGCLLCLLLVMGTLFSYLVGPFLSVQYFCMSLLVPFGIFLIIFGFFIPESPYYWILINDEEEAQKSIRKLRRCHNVQKELDVIREEIKKSRSSGVKIIKSRGLIKGLYISIGLMFFQQFSGISVFLGYMQSIFDAAGSTIKPEISSMIIGSIQVMICLVTTQLVDRLGRRILLIISSSGIILSTSLLGTYFYLKDMNFDLDNVSWVPIASLVLFMFSYNFGVGPLPWSILGELFPPNTKAFASAVATFSCFCMAFLTTVFFPNLILAFGLGASTWLFSIVSFLGLIFIIVLVPETKGRSLQEIQYILSGKNSMEESTKI